MGSVGIYGSVGIVRSGYGGWCGSIFCYCGNYLFSFSYSGRTTSHAAISGLTLTRQSGSSHAALLAADGVYIFTRRSGEFLPQPCMVRTTCILPTPLFIHCSFMSYG